MEPHSEADEGEEELRGERGGEGRGGGAFDAHRVRGAACSSLARGQTCTRTPTFMQLIKMCGGASEGERGREKYRE